MHHNDVPTHSGLKVPQRVSGKRRSLSGLFHWLRAQLHGFHANIVLRLVTSWSRCRKMAARWKKRTKCVASHTYKQLAHAYYIYRLQGLMDGQGWVCACVWEWERVKDSENERKYFYTNRVVAHSLRGLPASCHLIWSRAVDRCWAAGSCLLHHVTAGMH